MPRAIAVRHRGQLEGGRQLRGHRIPVAHQIGHALRAGGRLCAGSGGPAGSGAAACLETMRDEPYLTWTLWPNLCLLSLPGAPQLIVLRMNPSGPQRCLERADIYSLPARRAPIWRRSSRFRRGFQSRTSPWSRTCSVAWPASATTRAATSQTGGPWFSDWGCTGSTAVRRPWKGE